MDDVKNSEIFLFAGSDERHGSVTVVDLPNIADMGNNGSKTTKIRDGEIDSSADSVKKIETRTVVATPAPLPAKRCTHNITESQMMNTYRFASSERRGRGAGSAARSCRSEVVRHLMNIAVGLQKGVVSSADARRTEDELMTAIRTTTLGDFVGIPNEVMVRMCFYLPLSDVLNGVAATSLGLRQHVFALSGSFPLWEQLLYVPIRKDMRQDGFTSHFFGELTVSQIESIAENLGHILDADDDRTLVTVDGVVTCCSYEVFKLLYGSRDERNAKADKKIAALQEKINEIESVRDLEIKVIDGEWKVSRARDETTGVAISVFGLFLAHQVGLLPLVVRLSVACVRSWEELFAIPMCFSYDGRVGEGGDALPDETFSNAVKCAWLTLFLGVVIMTRRRPSPNWLRLRHGLLIFNFGLPSIFASLVFGTQLVCPFGVWRLPEAVMSVPVLGLLLEGLLAALNLVWFGAQTTAVAPVYSFFWTIGRVFCYFCRSIICTWVILVVTMVWRNSAPVKQRNAEFLRRKTAVGEKYQPKILDLQYQQDNLRRGGFTADANRSGRQPLFSNCSIS